MYVRMYVCTYVHVHPRTQETIIVNKGTLIRLCIFTPGKYILLVNTHSWLAHTPGKHTLLISTHSWLIHTSG